MKNFCIKFFALYFFSTIPSFANPCTMMACLNGLFIDIPASYHWKTGSYRFDFEIDDKKVTCKGKLPLKSCNEPSIVCNGKSKFPEILIMESGCALPPNAQGFGQIQISEFPQKIKLTIFHNEKKIGKIKSTPDYLVTKNPNGKNCGDPCKQATIKLKLD